MDPCGGSIIVSTLDPVTLEEAQQHLEHAILQYEQAAESEGALLTGWVVIAEFIDRDGHPHLSAYAAEGLPYWRIDGLIEAAPAVMLYAEEFEGD